MATSQRKSGSSGRVTPKGTAPKSTGRTPPRSLDPDQPVNVGRRPSSPAFLLLVAVMWLAVGVVLFLSLSTSWKYVPSIVALGIGLLFLRGAGATVLRRDRHSK